MFRASPTWSVTVSRQGRSLRVVDVVARVHLWRVNPRGQGFCRHARGPRRPSLPRWPGWTRPRAPASPPPRHFPPRMWLSTRSHHVSGFPTPAAHTWGTSVRCTGRRAQCWCGPPGAAGGALRPRGGLGHGVVTLPGPRAALPGACRVPHCGVGGLRSITRGLPWKSPAAQPPDVGDRSPTFLGSRPLCPSAPAHSVPGGQRSRRGRAPQVPEARLPRGHGRPRSPTLCPRGVWGCRSASAWRCSVAPARLAARRGLGGFSFCR